MTFYNNLHLKPMDQFFNLYYVILCKKFTRFACKLKSSIEVIIIVRMLNVGLYKVIVLVYIIDTKCKKF